MIKLAEGGDLEYLTLSNYSELLLSEPLTPQQMFKGQLPGMNVSAV